MTAPIMGHRLSLPVLLLGLAAWTQPAPTVGFVLSLDGPWQVYGRAIRQGEAVPAGVRVLLAAGTSFAADRYYTIDIVLLDSKHLSLKCASAQACRTGLLMPGGLVPQASFGSRLADVFSLIFATPERYVGLMSRGGSAARGGFVDGVAKIDGGRLALAPFFRGLPSGSYRLEFAREASEAAPATATVVEWNGSPASATAAVAVTPALYRVNATRPADPAFAPIEAWILVTTTTSYDAARTAFDEAMKVTRAWTDVPAKDVAVFRHAYLTHLATTVR